MSISSPPPPASSGKAEAVVLDYAAPSRGKWSAGTLTYTTFGLAALFFWLLLGDFALYLRERSVFQVAQLFLKREGASDATIAFLLYSLPPLLSVFISPIVSYRSDRLRTRWGRRIPYLLIPTPIAALSMIAIAFVPQMSASLHAALGGRVEPHTVTIIVFGFFWTIFEVSAIVSMAVFGGLINDVVPRSVLGRFFGMFRAVSLIDAIIFNWFLLAYAETHFFEIFIGIAIIFGVGFGLMCLKVREGEYPPPPDVAPDSGSATTRFFRAVATYFRECYSKPYYLLIYLALAMALLSFASVTGFVLLYAKQMNVDMALYGKVMAGNAFVSLALTVPLGFLVDKLHPLRLAIGVLCIHAVVTGVGALFVADQTSFLVVLLGQTFMSSCYYTVTASLPQRLYPKSTFTQFASAGTLLASLTGVVFAPALGAVLDATDHNYRLTFVASSALSLVALMLFVLVYMRWQKLGGARAYIAPGDELAGPPNA